MNLNSFISLSLSLFMSTMTYVQAQNTSNDITMQSVNWENLPPYQTTFNPYCIDPLGAQIQVYNKNTNPVECAVRVTICTNQNLPSFNDFFKNISVTVTNNLGLNFTQVGTPATSTNGQSCFSYVFICFNYPGQTPAILDALVSIKPDFASITAPITLTINATEGTLTPNQGASLVTVQTPLIQIPPVSSIAQLPQAGNTNFAIKGVLQLNQDRTFNNNLIFLLPNAKIAVISNINLTLNQVNVDACKSLGTGIELLPTARLTATSSKFRNCIRAINAHGSSRVNLKSNSFANNYIGFNATSGTVKLEGFYGNDFFSDAVLLPTTALGPIPGRKGYVGINLNNFKDFNSWDGNTFHGLSSGIIAKNSNLNLDNIKMWDIAGLYADGGTGIRLIGNGSSWTNIGKSATNTFTNMTKAIHVSSYGGFIGNCTISQVQTGIHWQNSMGRDKIITENNINALRVGIFSELNEPNDCNGRNITNNVINARTGIYAKESATNTIDLCGWRIKGNVINGVFSGTNSLTISYGIRYSDGFKGEIRANPITNNLPNGRGIEIRMSRETLIASNDCKGSRNGVSSGIAAISSPNSEINLNMVDGQSAGIFIRDQCDGSYLTCNQMIGQKNGLQYGTMALPTAVTLPHDASAGNQWDDDSFLDFAAKSWAPIGDIRYEVSTISTPPDPAFTYNPTSISPSDWFYPVPESAGCGTATEEPCGNAEQLYFLNEGISGDFLPASRAWKQAFQILLDLDSNSEWVDCASEYQQFQSEHTGTPIALLAKAKSDMSRLAPMQSLEYDIYAPMAERAKAKSEQLLLLDKQRAAGEPIDEVYYTALHESYIQVIDSLDAIYDLYKVRMQQDLTQLAMQNEAINADGGVLETNQKLVNQARIQLFTTDTLTTDLFELLTGVAAQCPISGGNAVYEARSMTNWEVENEISYDESICSIVQDRSSQQQVADLVVFPNPSSTMIHWTWQKDIQDVRLYNALGAVVQAIMETSVNALDISDLPAGYYQLVLQSSNGSPKTTPVIILK
jgi:hypothetical protein